MEWEQKVQLAQLGNRKDTSLEAQKEFEGYVIEHIEFFDSQDWDIFSNVVEIVIDAMQNNTLFWEKVYTPLKKLDTHRDAFSFRASVRLETIILVCEEHLKLGQTNE